jgi:hypothetical protein
MATSMKEDEIIVVQETEYTGAGKHMNAQISFAMDRGINLVLGNPLNEKPGTNLIFPNSASMLKHKDIPLDQLRLSYLKRYKDVMLLEEDYQYLALELNITKDKVKALMEER